MKTLSSSLSDFSLTVERAPYLWTSHVACDW